MNDMLVPMPWEGNISSFKYEADIHPGYEWLLNHNHDDIHLALYQRWPSNNLPLGYNFYIVSFHLEAVDIKWLTQQSKRVNNIIVLFDGNTYNTTIPNVTFFPYYYWHIQLNTMSKWFNGTPQKHITTKASAVCNRITESKLIIFTAIAEYIGTHNSMLVLRDWLEKENISKTHEITHTLFKHLVDTFFNKYYGTTFTIDTFDNEIDNYQRHTASPWQPMYQNCAIHFTNESFHYSDTSPKLGEYMYPGPFITEKTLKCLLGQTAFIPVGQFDTYGTLIRLGFEFDYNFDISFDSIIGDHDRLLGIVHLIQHLATMPKEEIFEGTINSSIHNYNHIISGDFYNACENINQSTIEKIQNIIK